MADPLLTVATAVAAAVAGKTAEAGWKGIGKLVEMVKRRFSKEPSLQAALDAAAADPEAGAEGLATALKLAAASDPELAQALEDVQAHTVNQAESGGTVMNVSGTVHGTVTQIGNAGDVHIG